MDFSLSKKEILFQQMIRAFAEKEVKPLAAEVDEEERFPIETVEKMAKLGIMGIPFPVEYGGAGGDNILYSMAVEELSRVCATTGVTGNEGKIIKFNAIPCFCHCLIAVIVAIVAWKLGIVTM